MTRYRDDGDSSPPPLRGPALGMTVGSAPFMSAPSAPFGLASFGLALFGPAPFGLAPLGRAPFGPCAVRPCAVGVCVVLAVPPFSRLPSPVYLKRISAAPR